MKLALLACLLSALSASAAELTLLNEGKSDYQIVMPDKLETPALTECIAQTARLVQTAFKANGAEVRVVAERSRDAAKPALFLRDTRFAREHGVHVTKLRDWSYAQRAAGKDIIIALARHECEEAGMGPRGHGDRHGDAAETSVDGRLRFAQKARGGEGAGSFCEGAGATG